MANTLAVRRVGVFRNGRHQAIRIPREFELPGKAILRQDEEGRLMIELVKSPDLLTLLSRCRD